MVLTSLSLLLFAAGALGAIIPARNAHTAPIDDIPAGGVGRVDTDNPSVRVHIKAGMLVPVDGAEAFDAAPPALSGDMPSREEIVGMVDEIHRRGTALADARAEVERLSGLLHERDAELTARDARIADLEASVRELEAGASPASKKKTGGG